MLTDDDWVLELGAIEGGEVTRTTYTDGASTWTLTAPYLDGTVVQRWEIGAGGELAAWSFDYLNVDDPEKRITDPTTAGQMILVPVSDPDPIQAPDADVEPDIADFGLPHDFPLGAP